MITAASAEELYVGAGDVWYDRLGTGILEPVGATMDDNVFRVTQSFYSPDLNGTIGRLKGTDYIVEELAELEVTVPQVSPEIMALAVPGTTSTTRATTDTGGGISTTLAAATVAGQYLAVKLTAVAGLLVGDYVRVGTAPNREFRKLTRVGTLGAGGTGVDLDFPLVRAHANAEAFVETDGNGATVISPAIIGRIPSTSYKTWVLAVPGLDGREARFWVKNAIMTESPEFTAGDESTMAPRLTLQSRRDPAVNLVPDWEIEKLPVIS